ncbi:MAG TPA: citramalate synthase [Geminicoccus sp.]|jgi:2-isopropylmalate synthase|uniref:citramalate synthase n=1 Tax=Geminicoccus sp. TaxID=2024832 RepID=UPI002E37F3A1|nr:citramalate synthase [Geminicoccus sp.]HEX2526776.1 citramalate synthase [Geminicoccus sp.]
MTTERIWLYDTTLRDGAQTQGVDFSVGDKTKIARLLDELGIDYVEGGWPGANPTDDQFFAKPPALARATFTAFGMTRRAGRSADNDPVLSPLLRGPARAVTLVGKSSREQVEEALGIEPDENLRMIADSITALVGRGKEAIFDAEHFFDGWKKDPGYGRAALEAALAAGARWIVLCDTNGGALPHEVAAITRQVVAFVPPERLGIHTHDDTGNAVANSIAAVREGARQVQGTLNGLGERCGNANLVTLIPTLMLKMGFQTGVSREGMKRLTQISRTFDERLNRTPNRHAPYVGASAFAHKAGLHASAVAKDPRFYEHLDPALVGNTRDVLVSDQAGRSNLMARFAEMGLAISPTAEQVQDLLRVIKEREAEGWAYDGAAASFEVLVRRSLGLLPNFFELQRFRVINERRFDGQSQAIDLSEASIKVAAEGHVFHTVAEGNGPVNALDTALRSALGHIYPCLRDMQLVDYKVRILTPRAGTAAVTRVIIESADEDGRVWQTVGVSGNIIDASYAALCDAIVWKLVTEQRQSAAQAA